MTDSLEVRLRRLEDERAIVKTLQAYGQAIDYGDRAMFVDCFAAEAVLDLDGAGRFTGARELGDFFDRFSAPMRYDKHLVLQPLIEIDGDKADVLSYFLFLQNGAEGPGITHYGRYHDRFFRDADGAWRISRRHAVGEAVAGARLP